MVNIIIFFVTLSVAIWYMVHVRNRAKKGQMTDSLSGSEKVYVWVSSLLNPIFSGAVFYYGWKKIFPHKAKQANNISLWAFLIELIAGAIIFFLLSQSTAGFNMSQTPTKVDMDQYSYTIPAGWQTVSENSNNVEAVHREKQFLLSIQIAPLSSQLMRVSSIVDAATASDIKSITEMNNSTLTVDDVNQTTIGGEKAYVTNAHQILTTSAQSTELALVQYNVFHKGTAYTLVFVSPYDDRVSATTDIQFIVGSFKFNQ